MTEADFKVKTKVFEGPLDLLLHLIEKRKLLINDISLAEVADDFVSYVKQFDELPLGDTSHFLLVASTLILIKSKSLLPTLELSEDEQADVLDLERRLKMYQRIQDASRHVRARFGKEIMFAHEARRGETAVFAPHKRITLENIRAAIASVLANLPVKELVPQAIVRKVVSLEEMIGRLTARMQSALRMSFREFSGAGKAEKVDVIVSFLAMLELVKQGALSVMQNEHFSDIQMESQSVGLPNYS